MSLTSVSALPTTKLILTTLLLSRAADTLSATVMVVKLAIAHSVTESRVIAIVQFRSLIEGLLTEITKMAEVLMST